MTSSCLYLQRPYFQTSLYSQVPGVGISINIFGGCNSIHNSLQAQLGLQHWPELFTHLPNRVYAGVLYRGSCNLLHPPQHYSLATFPLTFNRWLYLLLHRSHRKEISEFHAASTSHFTHPPFLFSISMFFHRSNLCLIFLDPFSLMQGACSSPCSLHTRKWHHNLFIFLE